MQNEIPSGWPEGYGRRILISCDSTLNVAARMASGLTRPEWILAYEQTSGRGRRGRAWQMPKGNFAATLIMPLEEAPAQAALRSFVASLALRDAFVALTGQEAAFQLKWPNDVLLRGDKVAGILLETIGQGKPLSHLAIGIGVNLAKAPPENLLEKEAFKAVSLRSVLGIEISPEAFLTVLAKSYARFEARFQTYGFAPLRREWLAHAARLGEVITARTMHQNRTGIFQEVDEMGQLVLETTQGRIAIPAADVYF